MENKLVKTFPSGKILQGSTHEICEDYATWGYLPDGRPYAVVCDGCSRAMEMRDGILQPVESNTFPGSHTDVGARLLAWAAVEQIRQTPKYNYGSVSRYAVRAAESAALKCGIPTDCLSATLLFAVVDDDFVDVFVEGDGAVVGIKHDDTYDARIIKYSMGAPFYPAYTLSDEGETRYREHFGGGDKTVSWFNSVGGELHTRVAGSTTSPCRFNFELSMHKAVLLFTDGIEQVCGPDGQLLSAQEAIKEIMQFKGANKTWVERRMNFYAKDLARAKRQHYDDLTVAGIITNPHG